MTIDFDGVFDADDYLYFYADTLASERTGHQVDVLERELVMLAPMRVLDLGCGHGRHAGELARRGYRVVGVDRAAGFLDWARAEAAASGLTIDYRHGDMAELAEEGGFDRVVCLFDAFGFGGDADNFAALAAMARALEPGGKLCLDIRNRDWMIRNILPVTVLEKGADYMIDRHQFDMTTGRLADERVMVRGGRVRKTPFSIRLYSYSEIRLLLELAGFSLTHAFGSWDGAPVSMRDNRMVLFCDKRPTAGSAR